MSGTPRTYSALSAEEQAAVSVWIDGFEQSYQYEGATALKKTVKAAPEAMRAPLVSQLLPSLIDHDRERQGRTPTLHELRSRFPDLTGVLTDAYPLLPAGYRLPVQLRGYRVLRVVGEGGQAIVLRAQDDMHSAVAIKLSVSPEHNEMLLRERELLGQCQHPGIPEVIASGVNEDRAFFVMPYLRGMTLADKYATHRPPAGEATRIAAELCGVVDHLHSRGILHRDIKPQNVWLDESGGVKLIDLGMAIDRSSWGSPRAAVTEFHGTPAFMSPEQAAGDVAQDGELSDVFSIGAVLYWMGTGTSPYGGGSQESVLTRAAAGKIERDRLQAISNWPKSLTRLCLEAIASETSQRIASAAELRERLRSQPSPAAKPQVTRSRLVVILATLLGLAAAAVFIQPHLSSTWGAALPSQGDADSTEPRVDRPSRANLRWIDQAAKMARVDLASIAPDQFTVGVNCRARLAEPWGDQPRGPNVYPELMVKLDKSLIPLTAALQYRVGESAWGDLSPSSEPTTLTASLSMVAAAGRGPVQIRLVSDPSGQPEAAAGPFRYELDISHALKEDEQAFGRELLEEAATEKCFDVEQPGWAVRETYSRRIGPIVDEFYFGEQRDRLVSINTRFKKLAANSGAIAEHKAELGLRDRFALVSDELQDTKKLWVAIRFSGGGTLGPMLYSKPLTEQQKRQQRVDAWFAQIKSDQEVAQYNGSKFVLTRLNEVLPDLTHLHIVGRYAVYGSDKGPQVIDSAEQVIDLNQLPEDRVIGLSPVWTRAIVRGRLVGGGFTPSFEILHRDPACGCGVAPIAASPGVPRLETFLYIDRDAYPDVEKSILPLLVNPRALQRDTVEACKRTRLLLSSLRPADAVRVEHYADRDFKKPLETVKLGIVYARYFNADGESIGHSAYRITPELIREWTEHALWHVAGPDDLDKMREQQKAMLRKRELRQRGG